MTLNFDLYIHNMEQGQLQEVFLFSRRYIFMNFLKMD